MQDIAKILEKYPPSEICDEWQTCADDCNIHARDMHCEDCDMYWELVELEEIGDE